MTAETVEYFAPIIAVRADEHKLKAFAKYLYEKDLSGYNPRIFNKTPLLQDQIQQSWNSVQKWWFAVLQDGGFDCDKSVSGFCKFNKHHHCTTPGGNLIPLTGTIRTRYRHDAHGKKVPAGPNSVGQTYHGYEVVKQQVLYYKDFLYDCYSKVAGCGYGKMDKSAFFRSLKHDCLDTLLEEVRPKAGGEHKRISYILFPPIEQCQDMFNRLQGYAYTYQEEETEDWDDGGDSSEDSEDD
jgi:hypothetical protein